MWDDNGWWSEQYDDHAVALKVVVSYRDFKVRIKKAVAMQQKEKQPQTLECSTFAFERQDGRKRKRKNAIENNSSQCGCL